MIRIDSFRYEGDVYFASVPLFPFFEGKILEFTFFFPLNREISLQFNFNLP